MKKLTLLFAILVGFAACGSDDDDEQEQGIKYTYDDLSYSQGTQSRKSTADSWAYENTADWAWFSPGSGRKGETTTYVHGENPTDKMRYDTVTVIQTWDGKTYKNYTIYRQAANPEPYTPLR